MIEGNSVIKFEVRVARVGGKPLVLAWNIYFSTTPPLSKG
jgi:hypothetical protein